MDLYDNSDLEITGFDNFDDGFKLKLSSNMDSDDLMSTLQGKRLIPLNLNFKLTLLTKGCPHQILNSLRKCFKQSASEDVTKSSRTLGKSLNFLSGYTSFEIFIILSRKKKLRLYAKMCNWWNATSSSMSLSVQINCKN